MRYEINKERLSASAVENRMEMLEVELQLAGFKHSGLLQKSNTAAGWRWTILTI